MLKNSAELTGPEILENSMVYVEYDGDTGIANIAKYQDRGPQTRSISPAAAISDLPSKATQI